MHWSSTRKLNPIAIEYAFSGWTMYPSNPSKFENAEIIVNTFSHQDMQIQIYIETKMYFEPIIKQKIRE